MVRGRRQRRALVRQSLEPLLVETLAHRREQVLAHRERAEARVGARHHDPGRLAGRGLAQERVGHLDEALVELEVFQVALRHPPARLRIARQFLHALSLLAPRQVKPVLEHQHAFVAEHFLEALDLADLARELTLADLPFDALDDRHGVPGTEKDADLALGRQRAPEAPQRRPLVLFVRGVEECAGEDVARVHPLVEQVHRLALARALDTGDQDEHGKAPVLLQVVLRIEQRLAQFRRLAPVNRLVEVVLEIRRFKHGLWILRQHGSAQTDLDQIPARYLSRQWCTL